MLRSHKRLCEIRIELLYQLQGFRVRHAKALGGGANRAGFSNTRQKRGLARAEPPAARQVDPNAQGGGVFHITTDARPRPRLAC